jgi:hypothetical protein
MIFDHDDGNWKNSEVARNLMEILASAEVNAPAEEPVAEVPFNYDSSDLVATAKNHLGLFYKESSSLIIINELNKVASEAVNRPSVALELELAIEDIKSLFD